MHFRSCGFENSSVILCTRVYIHRLIALSRETCKTLALAYRLKSARVYLSDLDYLYRYLARGIYMHISILIYKYVLYMYTASAGLMRICSCMYEYSKS